ncbi:anti-sigma factor antagonist [Deinococcus misasensis]|uniref:anti-sigma factor antagonist n=1 Tax=Deinococcus misasensis TaxID=392413 RepID=UPI0005548D15|nr:anti-sigma factor antagonist [Deinococcus misasensis]
MSMDVKVEHRNQDAVITLSGQLDAAAAPAFKSAIEEVFATPEPVARLVILMQDLEYMASAGLRALVFAKQKAGAGIPIVLVAPQEGVRETIEMTGFHHSVEIVESYA